MTKVENSKLNNILTNINKKFGEGTIRSLGDARPIVQNLLSTGSLLIDQALGGGLAYGRIIEVYGVESSGKTTFCLQCAVQCQRAGGRVAIIDVENALDVDYARRLGLDVNALIFTQPSSGEQALEIAEMLATSGEINLIVVDSVAALTPQAELDGEMTDMNIGLLARLMSKAMRKLTHALNDKNCAMIFINQIREKVSTGFSMGPSETTTGGRALKFYASQRIELRKAEPLKSGQNQIGQNVKIKVVKNKISAPMKTCVVPLIYGEGFSAADEVIDLGIEYGLITKGGAWFTTHDGQRLQGKESVKAYYKAHEEAKDALKKLVVSKLFEGAEIIEEADPSEEEVVAAIVQEVEAES
jgi:recombination protein RecA